LAGEKGRRSFETASFDCFNISFFGKKRKCKAF
jgi:hypothetical protein